uniref:ARAD1A13882p n=1 Tax=Blastobotrys adeninivorans TaxID=409370 RepID=A0A060SYQ8_BLAAD
MLRWRVGLVLLAIVIFLWVASGFLVAQLAPVYAKPYFITYINTSTFTVYLIPTLIPLLQGKRIKQEYNRVGDGDENSIDEQELKPLTVRETAVLGAQFSVLWFLANCTNNAAYVYTSVASATILACTSSFFTLLVGCYCKVEQFSSAKVIALVISIVGVSCIAYADKSDTDAPANALAGNLFALISACVYGVYTTLIKVKVRDESRMDAKLFFGFVGLWNTILLWPVLILLHFSGFERFALPPSPEAWALVLLNAASTLVADFLWVLAMLMTTPLVVTVGLAGSIPLSMLGDMIINARVGSLLYFAGAALVCWSFVVINRQEQDESDTTADATYEPIN